MSSSETSVSLLQAMIESQEPNSTLNLPPGEYFGQIVIDRPITIVGRTKSTRIGSRQSPTIAIKARGVTLRNLMVEVTAGPEWIAIDAAPGTVPVIEDLLVIGGICGIADRNIGNTAESQPESSIRVYFVPPPPMGTLDMASDSAANSAPVDPKPYEASLVNLRTVTLFNEAEKAEKQKDWHVAVKVCEDILFLSPSRPDVERLLNRVRKKMAESNIIGELSNANSPEAWSEAVSANLGTIQPTAASCPEPKAVSQPIAEPSPRKDREPAPRVGPIGAMLAALPLLLWLMISFVGGIGAAVGLFLPAVSFTIILGLTVRLRRNEE